MLKNILKRTTSLVLAFVMVLGLLPVLTVPAAALDASIQYLSFSEKDSNGTWTASGKTITCEVTDNDESTTKCGETTYNWTSRSTSLTITNTSGSKGTLKLSPEKTDGQGTTDAQTSYTLDVDGSITITVTSKGNGSNKTGDTTIYTFRDITFVPETQTTVYFSPAVNGTYTVDGVDVGTGISGTKTNTEAYTLQVASVSEGYSFLGWYETVNGVESLYSSSDPASYLATEGANVTAKFVPSAPANFDVGNRTFTNFGDALTYQQISGATTIVVLQDCTIPAGNYTIPAGVTLLVPFDGANTLYTNAPGTVEAYGTPTRYRTLTLASGANIVVNGAISVSAKQSSATVGAPTGPYGELHMSTGSTITCNSGAKLYAWGFITGSGTIQMNSGSTVYEDFQIADWRGGNATNNMRIGKWLGGASENEGKGVFPFSQYYVQNVQVPMTLEYGAEEKVYVSISAGGTVTERELSFIGTSALFQSREGGTIKKDYDESTDRLKVDVTGTLDIGSISLGFNIGISVTVDSSDYVLPINGNMTVTAKSGGTINISKDVAFLPGAELIIERGAKSVISAGTKAVVYDADNWGNYCAQAGKSVPAPFAVGRGSTRWNVNTDASICVNGTLDASAGALYTTEGGANIYSTTTQPGTVIMTAGTETTAYQATQSGTDITYSDIPITSAKLKNSNTTTENGEYTITADATSATTYYYSYDGYWSDTFEVTFKPNLPESGTYTVDGTEQQTEADIVKSVTNPLGTVVTPPVLTMNGYTFDGWYTQADGSGTKVDFSQSIARRSPTVYAKWKGDAGVGYKVEHYWQNADGTTYTMESEALSGTAGTTATAVQQSRTGFAVNTSKSTLSGMVKADGSLVLAVYYDRETYTITFDTDGGSAVGAIAKIHGAEVGTVAAPTREGYTFAGWDTTIPATMPMENMTIKAQWTINQYTITFDTDGGSAVAAIKQDYGTAVTAPADPTKTGYKFTGWNVEVPATMPARDMTITAQWTINQYTITFDTDGGSAVAPITQDYNTAVTAPSNPTKEGYTFADWDVEVPSTMPAGDMTITAQWTIESYTINFDAAGGSKVGSITAEYGAPITMPDDPTKTGYSFAGWSESYTTMPDCGDNGTTKTITAQWTANTYTVQFNANGGTGAMDAQSGFVYDEAQNLTANNGAITKEGYSFTGWNTEADGSGTAYADGASVKNLSSDVDGSVTLFAQWSINGYTLTLKANGGKFSNDSDTYTTTLHYGVTIENLPEPTRTGYTFSGWSPKIPETMPAEDMVITAMWEILQYTITFVNEGETVGTITQNYGTTISESNVPVVSKPGYRFVGWDKEIPTTMPAESMTITAQWEAESYTVTLNPGELGSFVGSEAGTPTVVQVTYGKNYASEEAPLPTPTRVGYNFIAWQDESGNTITYSSEVAIPKNHELTAVWDPMKFQVTFNAGEGSFEDDVETQWTVTYDSTYGAMEGSDTLKELPTPKREGHTFLGWFTSTAEDTPAAPPLMLEEETTQSDAKVTSDAKVQIVENTTLYARWEINYYTITLDRDDGTEPEKIVQLFNTPLSIADPVREGHTFRGWDVDIPNTMPADNLTIKATWDINQYTITFVNGNETVKTITQDYDATIARSDVPAVSRNGYTFSGWDKDIPDKMPAYDMIITAQWDANEYQIVFDSDGGTPVDTITADCDTVIIAPAAPTKTGFTFIGWDPALPNAMPAGGLSVKAIWKVNQYSIIFDTDGGSAVAPITADYSEPITAPAAPTREGYTFLYWQNTAGEEYTIPAKMPAENVEVKAVWSINCYTITFNPNGENVENSESSREVTYGEAYGILPEPTRDGYGFNGWFTESNGGTQVTAETVMGAADVTVYAHWNKSEYGITYVLNGGSVNGTNPTTYSVTTPNFALIDPVKTGYSFTGWNLCVDGEEQGNVGKAYVVMTGTTGELSFTATWTANTYTVQFNANGGEGTMAEQGGFVYDETKNLKANAGSITKEGYSFAGWNTEADGSGTACADGAAVKNLSSTVNGRVTLYAQWTANTYTVQFDANGGTGSMAEQIGFVYDEAKNLTANEGIITKEGYTFAGWNAERDGSGTAYADGALVKNLSSAVNGCVILYAQWTINNYELKLHANGGMFSSGGDTYTTTVEYNAAPETLPEPTREGYTFTGWGAEIPSTMPAENLEFTAQWSINSYTMTWIVDGVETEKTYEYGAAIEKIADPAKTGYTFTGWGAEVPETMPAENLEFTAQWRINSYTVTWIVDSEKTEKTYEYGATIEKIADPSKPGYIFTGWDVEIPETMPAENVTITATWESYLDKLVDIPAVDIQKGVVVQNPDTTALDLARGYYALLNSQQKAAYATEEIYASHYAVFREVVVKYAETQLIKGVKAAEDSTNEVLSDVTYSPSESETITVDVARITVDSTTAEGMLIFDQFPALLMLDIPFLMELFAYEEIKQVYVPCLETSFDKEGNRTWQLGSNPYTLNRKDRNEAGGMTKTDQFNIMFLVAWAALAPETSHEEFLNGLYAQMSTLTIGLLDGKTVEVELIAQTAEGFEYKVLFTIHFHNQNHYAIWHWGEITRGVIAENLELVLPAFAAGEKVENTAYEAYPEGSMVTLPDDPAKEGEIFQPTKEGYTFEGWVDAQGKLISPDTEGGITAMERDHLIYTGKWRINQYTITFDTDGGTEIAPITADYGAAITTPAVEPTKIGHTFTGWDTELPPTMPAVNMTIKALWSVNKYTYTFDTNGGSEMADLTRDYGSEIGAVGEPVREGYTFVGWVDKNGDAYTFPATMPAESIALTAVWSVNSYTITFDTDGGTPITPITQEYGTAVNAPSDPSKSGYTFAGWDVEIPATMPARDINIKAIWTVNQYTIVFDSDGGSAVDPITADYGEAITEPETIPTKTGYTFKEWSPAVPKTMPVNGLTVTALWTPNTYQVILNPNGGVLNSSDEVTVTYGETYSALYELPVPSKEGYTFDCWMMGDQRITANTRVEITDNITLTAAWLVGDNYYSIDFDLNEGGWESGVEVPKQFNVESEDIVLPAPVKIGYTFLGWTGSNGNEPELTVIIETGSTGNKAYVANWQVNQYTITFVDTGDVVYEPITKDYGAVIGAVADPVKTGYTFQGWSMAIPNTMPAENLTITAAWEINRYTITFDTDGGTTISPITRNYGETVGTVADPTKEGYTFVGWNPALPDTMPSENLTVTAQWAVNQYTITFDTGGGTPVDSITADYGATIVAPVAPEKEGHTFAGWSVKIPTTMPAKNMTITAYWTVNSYTITFLDTGDEEYAPITRDYGADVGDVADPVKTGYTFIGWDTEIPVTMPAGNLVITAMWKINQYTITFDTDGGTEIAPITADFGTPITAPADPVKEGYTFAGWSPALPATMPGENLTVKAQWRTNQYTITFDTDGGTEVAPITADYGANVTAPMAPTKEGHTFIGWLPSLPSTMPAGDLTVKAQWAVNQYTITFKSNGGSYVDSITGDYGAAIAAPAAPERKGYTFAGWVPTLPDTMPAQNMAVTAQWTANTYVVTLDADGGSVENDRITVTYDAAYTLPEPTRQGYTFVGWFNRDDGSQQIALTGVVNFAQDLVLKARWNAKGDTPYKVEHYQQNLTDDKYTLVKTDEGTGASGSVVEVSQLNDAGFRVNEGRSVLKGTIAGDGTLVLRVYYDRKVYTVSWNVAGTITNQDYRYGAIPDDSAINTERASDSSASYIFNGWDKELVPVSGDVTYTAQFTKRYEAALINADGTVRATYSELAYALKNVPPGSVLRLEADATLTENLWIPAGVTLVLPCMDDDPGYVMRNSGKLAFNPDGTDTSGAVGQGPNAKLYRALNIPSNIQVVVQGAILVNAVTGRPSAGNYDMDVTGGYSQIQLDGTIVVADGGKLDCFGYVKGEGTLIATSGGTVGDLYIVRHWRGGTHGLAMFEEDVYPMNEADCRNIEANLKIEYGAKLDGLVKMYAGGTYNYTRFPQVDSSNGLIRLAGRSSFVVRSYDAVNEREVYEISGGANFAASTLTIVGVPLTSSDFLYPIDGDMDFILKKGDYSFVNDYKVMPGATMTVAGNATLTIAEQAAIETPGTDKGDDGKVTVVFYDEYNDLYTGPTQYPTGMAAAKVILEDGATFTNKGVFAGTIYTNSDNVLVSNQVTPVWNAVSRETEAASVVSGGKLGKRHVDLLFDLAIYREGYTWRFGETDRGEVEGSIIWYKDDVVSVNAQIAQTSDTSITVRTEVYNTTDVAVECNLYIAVYDSQNRLIAVKICDGYVLGTNQFNELRDFTIAIDKVAATVKLFLVDADFVPMTDMVPLNVK